LWETIPPGRIKNPEAGQCCFWTPSNALRRADRLSCNLQSVRIRLSESHNRFSIQVHKPRPRQLPAVELSRLWMVLENASPEKMKGYGTEFSLTYKAAWEELIGALVSDVKEMSSTLVKGRVTP